MKNIALNTLRYTGVVTLSQYVNSKKIKIAQIHNEGGNPLFSFLTDCLLGDFELAKLDRPTKIMLLLKNTTENETTYTSASGFVYLIGKPEKISKTASSGVRYSFVVPRDMIESAQYDSIGLYTNSTSESDCNNYAAVCDLDITDDISSSAALVIDWELNISNREENT